MTETQVTAYQAPEIPSKWDIIPIHNSDRASFKRCRRYWDWNSPARNNLVLRADVHGINFPLWFGTGIHYALEQYYTPGLRRDPVEAWKTWFDIQWRGGMVTEEWLPRVYDLKPRPIVDANPASWGKGFPPTWVVRGLEDIIPTPNHDEFDEHFTLGIEMMSFYKEYAEANDYFTVLVAEHDFSIPIWDYHNEDILHRTDTREDSPNYGNVLEVHARGRCDALKVDNRSGKLGIIDYKTAAKIDEDYFLKLDSDEQCTSYLHAIEVEAKYYDLPYKNEPIEEVLYIALRKNYPKSPTKLNNGMFSVDRANESCTYPMLIDWIAKNMPGVPLNEKQQNYINWLKEVGDDQFIIRRPVRRNRHQIANAGRRLYMEALDMLDPAVRIYPNITNDFKCLGCQFRAPCLALEDGSDWQMLINDNYSKNKDR